MNRPGFTGDCKEPGAVQAKRRKVPDGGTPPIAVHDSLTREFAKLSQARKSLRVLVSLALNGGGLIAALLCDRLPPRSDAPPRRAGVPARD